MRWLSLKFIAFCDVNKYPKPHELSQRGNFAPCRLKVPCVWCCVVQAHVSSPPLQVERGECSSTVGYCSSPDVISPATSVHASTLNITDNESSEFQKSALLTTYFLSVTNAVWRVLDSELSIYSLQIPLKDVADWVPVITPDKSGMTHSVASSKRFLLDWVALEEHAKSIGEDYFAWPKFALESTQRGDWSTETIKNMIESGEVFPRHKSSTTVMLSTRDIPYSAVGDVMGVRMVADKPDVSHYFTSFMCKMTCTVATRFSGF